MPHRAGDEKANVVFNPIPEAKPLSDADHAFMEMWENLHAVRNDVSKALEMARAAKVIGASLEAAVDLYAEGELYSFLRDRMEILPEICIVSAVALHEEAGGTYQSEEQKLGVLVRHADGEKCVRCWKYTDTVGSDGAHPTLCSRCAGIVK